MKRFALFLVLFAVIGFFAFANGEQDAAGTPQLKDGIYFAQADQFSEKTGWKYNVTIEVKDGKIVSADWNGANVDAGKDKKTLSKDGEYGLVEKGGGQAPWWKQAEAVENYFVKSQSTDQPDAISGATIGIEDFYTLAQKALAAGPVGYGPYRDGVYRAQQSKFDHGYKYFVELTVTSGYVVAANWDALAEDGGKNKVQTSKDGEYGMFEKGGAQAPWWKQARAVEDYFLKTQDPTMPDAISGATIGLEEFFQLASEALQNAQR